MDQGLPPAGSTVPVPVSIDPGIRLDPQAAVALLTSLLALTDDAILATDSQLRVTVFNRGAAHLFGYAAHEVLGQPLVLLFPPLTTLDPATAPSRMEYRPITGVRHDGASFVASVGIASCADANGSCLALVLRVSTPPASNAGQPLDDVSLLQHIQDAVITSDLAFRITGWNPAAEVLYGWRTAEALGQNVTTLLQTEHLERSRAQVLAEFRAHGVWKGEVIQRHRNGHPIAILAAVATIRAPTGEPIGVITVNRDISARKAAEDQLRAQAERLAVLAAASQAFAQAGTDERTVLDLVARRTADPLGAGCIIRLRSDDEQWLDVVTIYDQNPAVQAAVWEVAVRHRVHVDDPNPVAVVLRSGQPLLIPVIDPEAMRAAIPPELWAGFLRFHPHSTIITPLQAHGQMLGSLSFSRHVRGLPAFTVDDLTLAQDLADRAALAIANVRLFGQLAAERALLASRVAERTADLSRANADLASALRLKDAFLATMSHELRTPLNAILGRAEALQEAIYGAVTPQQQEALRSIGASGHQLLTLINDILDLSKLAAGQLALALEPVDVPLLCQLSTHKVAQQARTRRITVTTTLDSQFETIQADARRLTQILVNLLTNAVKFTPEGGAVGLEVRGDAAQQTVTFTVWDTGIGIAADDLPRLFQPFVQLDSALSRQYAGIGLGLALVRQLVEVHNGSITVESTLGEGSCFSVTLPWNPRQSDSPK
ncbi:MAG: PAS domain S-box protein [Chloroflexales bacterium]|nr:PAS domain S-box protein [Chloroflexales bacterium]